MLEHLRVARPLLLIAVAGLLTAFLLRQAQPERRRPSVLLITIDTLRADGLGCYGSATSTPNVDALARDGTLFENAACPMPATVPSHLSLFTSRYPRELGVVTNWRALAAGTVTLAETFKRRGYRTAGFTATTLLGPRSGADRGFDTFESPREPDVNAERVVPRVLQWLQGIDSTDRFFLWVHLFDPHMPYEPPPQYTPPDPRPGHRLQRVSWPDLLQIGDQNGGVLPRAVLDRGIELYAGEVAKTDHWVGAVLDALRARGMLDETVVAFTADHGECFEHGIVFEHYDCVYDGAAHVPLIIRYPPQVPAGERRRDPAELVDLAPTLLALAGLPVPRAFAGVPLFAPTRARPKYAMVQHPTYSPSAMLLRSERRKHLQMVGTEPLRPLLVNTEQYAVRGDVWKYIVTGSDEELYHIATDAGESENVAPDHPEVVAAMRLALQQWRAAHPARALEARPISRKVHDALQALGYVE